METLDCRGQQCPQPVIQVRQAILSEPGSSFRVMVDDLAARDNVSRMATKAGYTVEIKEDVGTCEIVLTPGQDTEKSTDSTPQPGFTVIFIGSDQMGNGDPKLGQILMKNFLFTLTESDSTPNAIYFVNNGVKLTVGGSDVIEPLQKLANSGVDIASCGLCLEFFGSKDALVVGRMSNMLELVNTLATADRVIRP